MWEYQRQIIEIKDPSDYKIVSKMDKFGQDGWEIFSITSIGVCCRLNSTNLTRKNKTYEN